MREYSELISLMERVIHKYTQWEDKKRTYGTDLPLSKAELHTIVAVGDNPNINITSLAENLGITKGAASQMIYKLVDKGVVEKKVSPDSDTAVVLNLTEQGLINYKAHEEYHRQTNDRAIALLREVPDSFYQYMLEYFSAFEKVIDEKLEK
ncbi:MAG: MarR family winged helix-turn-helix transcriptional regulator [Lachnospiraceae bacterium]|nr:MarR family winged helix-turn-helix transcriptional regulator [Lachnospiraceae bacterium]